MPDIIQGISIILLAIASIWQGYKLQKLRVQNRWYETAINNTAVGVTNLYTITGLTGQRGGTYMAKGNLTTRIEALENRINDIERKNN